MKCFYILQMIGEKVDTKISFNKRCNNRNEMKILKDYYVSIGYNVYMEIFSLTKKENFKKKIKIAKRTDAFLYNNEMCER